MRRAQPLNFAVKAPGSRLHKYRQLCCAPLKGSAAYSVSEIKKPSYFCNPSTTTKRSMAKYGQQENGNVSGGTCCNGCKYVGNSYLNGGGDRTMNKVVGFKVQERANDEG
jgi:hypothetical protein